MEDGLAGVPGFEATVTVTIALVDFEPSATLVAVTPKVPEALPAMNIPVGGSTLNNPKGLRVVRSHVHED